MGPAEVARAVLTGRLQHFEIRSFDGEPEVTFASRLKAQLTATTLWGGRFRLPNLPTRPRNSHQLG